MLYLVTIAGHTANNQLYTISIEIEANTKNEAVTKAYRDMFKHIIKDAENEVILAKVEKIKTKLKIAA